MVKKVSVQLALVRGEKESKKEFLFAIVVVVVVAVACVWPHKLYNIQLPD